MTGSKHPQNATIEVCTAISKSIPRDIWSLDSPLLDPFHAKTPTVPIKALRQPPSFKYNPPHVPQMHSLTGLPHATHVPFIRLGDHISHASASSVSKLNRISNIRIGSAYSVWLEITSSWP